MVGFVECQCGNVNWNLTALSFLTALSWIDGGTTVAFA
jgi:hypothetical protein